jgi:hypothetical protein
MHPMQLDFRVCSDMETPGCILSCTYEAETLNLSDCVVGIPVGIGIEPAGTLGFCICGSVDLIIKYLKFKGDILCLEKLHAYHRFGLPFFMEINA